MDKYLIRHSTFELLGELPPEESKPEFILGVIGSSNAAFWTNNSVRENILDPLLSEEEIQPSQILLPSDGSSSLLLQVWAERNKIPVSPITAEWKTLGARARAMRDSRIIKESTHLLFFLGGRSDYYEKMAIRELKKGKVVYVVDGKSHELAHWVTE